MDGIYLNYFNDKQPDNGEETEEDILSTDNISTVEPIEPMFTDISDGMNGWTGLTLDGYPVLMNTEMLKTYQKNSLKPELITVQPDMFESAQANNRSSLPSQEVLLDFNLHLANDTTSVEHLAQVRNEAGKNVGQFYKKIIQDNGTNKTSPCKSNRSVLKTRENLNGTANELIETVNAFKCTKCNFLSDKYDIVVNHVNDKHLKSNNNITIINNIANIIPNVQLETNKSRTIFLCGICNDAGYPTIENLKQHMINEHELVDASNEQNLLIELQDNSNSNLKISPKNTILKFKCSLKGCDVRFVHDDIRKKHESCHWENDAKRFKCFACDDKFSVWKLCSSHLWSRHKLDYGLYTCPICNKFKSISPNGIRNHMTTHTFGKPFLCNSCGKSFKQNTKLRTHLQICQSQGGSKRTAPKQTCTICLRDFADAQALKKHTQSVHDKYKPFICNICGHTCARKAMLELHLRQHTGEKPYSCDHCEYKTGDHNSLRRHVMKHDGTRKYKCPHCDYTAIQSTSYKNHIVKRHPGETGLFTCLLCPLRSVNEKAFKHHMDDHRRGLIKVNTENSLGKPTTKLISILQKHQNKSETSKITDEDEDTHSVSSNEEISDIGGYTISENTEK